MRFGWLRHPPQVWLAVIGYACDPSQGNREAALGLVQELSFSLSGY